MIDGFAGGIFLNVGERRMYDSQRQFHAGTIVFLSPYIEHNVFNDHCRISIGSHIYLNNIPRQMRSTPATINFGIGYAL